MTDPASTARRGPLRRWLSALLDSAAFARAFTLAALGSVLAQYAITRMAGAVTYETIVVGLCVVGAAVLWRRRRELELLRLLPLTLVGFVLWLLVSTAWADSTWRSLGGWTVIAALAFLAVVIAHVRDTLQTARALGDVLRTLLAVSLGLEILSGVLLDMPISFLGIQGNITDFGPLQGVFGTRNMLGFVSVLGLITFAIEWRTRTIRRGVAIGSIVLAGFLALFSASPTVFVLLIAVGLATGALALVRHAPAQSRRALQLTLGAVVAVGLAVAYAFRHPIIGVLNARSDFSTRSELWDTLLVYVRLRPVQGWGWLGQWRDDTLPYALINAFADGPHGSALNAYFDVLLQTGWVGLLLFAAMCALALGRSWLVATARRSVVYAWTPLMLTALLVDSVFESFTLSGAGWLLLVICVLRAGMSRSWREGLGARLAPTTPAATTAPGP